MINLCLKKIRFNVIFNKQTPFSAYFLKSQLPIPSILLLLVLFCYVVILPFQLLMFGFFVVCLSYIGNQFF